MKTNRSAARARPTVDAVASAETRAVEWDAWLTQRAAEAAEAEGDEEAIDVDPLLVEGLAALQRGVDVALARQERALVERAAVEIEALRVSVAALAADRDASEKRHATEVAGLRDELEAAAAQAADMRWIEDVN